MKKLFLIASLTIAAVNTGTALAATLGQPITTTNLLFNSAPTAHCSFTSSSSGGDFSTGTVSHGFCTYTCYCSEGAYGTTPYTGPAFTLSWQVGQTDCQEPYLADSITTAATNDCLSDPSVMPTAGIY